MVQLYLNGKPRKGIIREYDLTPSSLDKWIGLLRFSRRAVKTMGLIK
ncbi:hypothetical protein E2R56_23880 [Rhodococcus qingshengii]|nr:hypothetical protein E2R56_23880 [Rhodococcus qingshengii]